MQKKIELILKVLISIIYEIKIKMIEMINIVGPQNDHLSSIELDADAIIL